jgi:predicted phosphodiesterase
MMFEKKPLMVMFGHMHHFQVDTLQKVKLIMSGSFCVNDEYCLNKRIIGEPSQTVVVINDKGVKCLYDCKLN